MKLNPFRKTPPAPNHQGGLPAGYDNRLTDTSSSAHAAYSGFPAPPVQQTPSIPAKQSLITDPVLTHPSGGHPASAVGMSPQGWNPIKPIEHAVDKVEHAAGTVAHVIDQASGVHPGGAIMTSQPSTAKPIGHRNNTGGFGGSGSDVAGATAGVAPSATTSHNDAYQPLNGPQITSIPVTSVDSAAPAQPLAFNQGTPTTGEMNHAFVASGGSGNGDFKPVLPPTTYSGFPGGGIPPTYGGFPGGGGGGVNPPTYGGFPSGSGSYAAFPGAGTTSHVVALTHEQMAAGMGDGDNPLHGMAGGVPTYGGFPSGGTPTYSGFPSGGSTTPPAYTGFPTSGGSGSPAPVHHNPVVASSSSKPGDDKVPKGWTVTESGPDGVRTFDPNAPKAAPTLVSEHGQGGGSGSPAPVHHNPVVASSSSKPGDDKVPKGWTVTESGPDGVRTFDPNAPKAAPTLVSEHGQGGGMTHVSSETLASVKAAVPSAGPILPQEPVRAMPTAPTAAPPELTHQPLPLVANRALPSFDNVDEARRGGGISPLAPAAPTIKPKLTLPPTSPHDMPLGGGFGGLDPASGAHKYLGRH